MTDIRGTIALLERSLSYHDKRHAVLASNIANVQTPGYRPQDVTFSDAMGQARALARTDARHLGPEGSATDEPPAFDDTAVAPGLDGNAVSMERQMAKMAANSLRYRAVAELINRRLGMMRYAATDGRR